MPAYAYLRKSHMPTGRKTMSPEAQLDAVKAIAKIKDDTFTEATTLSDWDISGSAKHTTKRKGYQDLIAAVTSGRATAVYSYSLSRLARSTKEVLVFFELCAEKKVPIRLVADSIDTSTASGKMMLTILASVAQFESDVASERRLATNQAKRDRGLKINTDKPYGSRPPCDDDCKTEHRHSQIVEDLPAVIAAYTATHSFTAAAVALNEAKVPPRRAQAWRASSVMAIVKRVAPELLAPNPVKRIASGGQPFALARLLRCGICGGMLTGRHGYQGKTRYYCSRGGVVNHPIQSVAESAIMPAIRAKAESIMALLTRTEQYGDPNARAAIDAERTVVRDMLQTGLTTKDDAARRMKALAERESRLESRRSLFLTRPAVFEDTVAEDGSVVPADDPARLNVYLRRLFDHIELDAEFKVAHVEPAVVD